MEYSLEEILLYLDNALPKKRLDAISDYLSKNPKDLQYVMDLTKNKTIDEIQVNRINIETTKNEFMQFCSGLVKLIKQENLAFRCSVKGCEYSFLDITLKFVFLHDKMFQLQLESKNPVYCEIVRTKDEFILFQEEFTKSRLISLEVGSKYDLRVYIDDEFKNLEIML